MECNTCDNMTATIKIKYKYYSIKEGIKKHE